MWQLCVIMFVPWTSCAGLHFCFSVIYLVFLHSFFSCFFLQFFLSSPLPNWRGGWLQLFAVHFLVRRLLSAARAILCLHNAVFTLTLIKVNLASKCCALLNTDCTERRKWKRQSKQPRTRGREQCVDKGQRNNSLMVIGDGWNNHGSRLTAQ